jgi:hypothetical protein
MTPEQLQQFEQMQQTINELKTFIDSFVVASNMPYEAEQSIRTRFQLERIDTLASIDESDKTANSENQAVNEAGSASYFVLKPPVRWTKIIVDGEEGQIPTYNT